jgi:Phage Mu protein F like protein
VARRNRLRISANRAMVRLERGYLRQLHQYQRATGRLASAHHNFEAVQSIIHDRLPGLQQLIKSWMKRVVFLFGPQVIDSLTQRKYGSHGIERKDAIDTFTEEVLAWLEDYSLTQATTITGTLTEIARRILIDAFEQGLGEEATASLLVDEVGGSVMSAARIARTEVHTAANIASDTAARSTGLDMVKEWASTEDSRTRQSHRDADGQRREMDEPFSVGGSSLAFPGDPNGPAREVINCRCVVLYHPRINGQVFD